VKNDSTCDVRGRVYEVPTHLRGRKVTLGYSLVHPERLWVEDGGTRVPIREVDALANDRRPRKGQGLDKKPAPPKKETGLNAVEDLLRRVTRPNSGKDGSHAT
jgi:hypothetical protein